MQNQSERDIKSEALLSLKTEIAKDLIVDYIIDHMIETDVFTEEEKAFILMSGQYIGSVDNLLLRDQVLSAQTFALIDLLREKMKVKDWAFNSFIFIVMKEGYYPWVGSKILNMVLQLKSEAQLLTQLSQTSLLEERVNTGLDYQKCCAKDCIKRINDFDLNLNTFHGFPLESTIRCQKWVEFCDNPLISELFCNNNPKLRDLFICSDHFKANNYDYPVFSVQKLLDNNCHPIYVPLFSNTAQDLQYLSDIPSDVIQSNLSPHRSPNSSTLSSSQSQSTQKSTVTESEVPSEGSALNHRKNRIIKNYIKQQLRDREEIKTLKEQLEKSKKKISSLKNRLKRSNPLPNTRKSKINYIMENIKGLDEEVLNPVMSEIIEYHLISAFHNKPRVPKWTNRLKRFCAELYHKSPTAYSFLQKTMTLPTKKTILKFTENRIQIAKNETFKQNIETNDNPIDGNVIEVIDKYTDSEIIASDPINDFFNNNEVNITIDS